MELNTRTKVVGGVLACALAALVCDRVFMTGPTPAEAAEPAAAAPPARDQPRASGAAIHRWALAERLKQLDTPEAAPRDVFVAPVAWFPKDEEPEVPPAAQPEKRVEPKRRLTSVIADASNRGQAAMIDGRLLRVGVPVNVKGDDGRMYEYVLVRAWFENGIPNATLTVNGRVQQLTYSRGDKDPAPEGIR